MGGAGELCSPEYLRSGVPVDWVTGDELRLEETPPKE
jgi:hypothetical protein